MVAAYSGAAGRGHLGEILEKPGPFRGRRTDVTDPFRVLSGMLD
jgi:hypothetical protein